jgi:two-component system, LytTR family, response regulator
MRRFVPPTRSPVPDHNMFVPPLGAWRGQGLSLGMSEALRVVIVEDEPISRDLLRSMLADSRWVEVVAEAGNVSDALAAILDHEPDLVFLDIQMPDGTGFDLIEAIGVDRMPATVFVTAYDEYAVKAFEVTALDYLMKPFDEVRLQRSLERVHRRLREGKGVAGSQLLALLDDLRAQGRTDYADRLAVDAGTHVKLIPTSEIDWLEAKGKHVLVHTRTASYSLREGLSTVTERLAPREFLRVHRSAVVRVDRVKEIHRWTRGDYLLVLHDGTKLVTGLTYRRGIEARLLGERRPPAG